MINYEELKAAKKLVKDITIIKSPTIPVLLKLLGNDSRWEICTCCNKRITLKNNACLYCYYNKGVEEIKYGVSIESEELTFVKQSEQEILKGIMNEAGYSI